MISQARADLFIFKFSFVLNLKTEDKLAIYNATWKDYFPLIKNYAIEMNDLVGLSSVWFDLLGKLEFL